MVDLTAPISNAAVRSPSRFRRFSISSFTRKARYLRTDDRRIPGFALDERIRAELTPEQRHNDGFGGNPFGEVPNTFVKTKDFGVGASYVWDKGYIGASYTRFLSEYGVPNDPEDG